MFYGRELNGLMKMQIIQCLNLNFVFDSIVYKNEFMKKNKVSDIDAFDFGYAISVHRSQGSEWDKVIVYADDLFGDDLLRKQLLYTSVTRAKKKLILVM